MDDVFAARKWDAGMAPEQFDLMTSNRAAQANTRAARKDTREQQSHDLEQAEAKEVSRRRLAVYAELKAANGDAPGFPSIDQWWAAGDEGRENWVKYKTFTKPYAARPAADIQVEKLLDELAAITNPNETAIERAQRRSKDIKLLRRNPQQNDIHGVKVRTLWDDTEPLRDTMNENAPAGGAVTTQTAPQGAGGQNLPAQPLTLPEGTVPTGGEGVQMPQTPTEQVFGVTAKPTFDERVEAGKAHKASAAAETETAKLTAKFNTNHRAKIAGQVDTYKLTLERLQRLRDDVAAGPASGQVEQHGAAWSAEKQFLESRLLREGWTQLMDMKADGVTTGSLTEDEFLRAMKTIGSLGYKKEANLAILDSRIKELAYVYNRVFDILESPEKFMDKKRVRWQPGARGPATGSATLNEAQAIMDEQES
jgi:hypothetical protein